MDTHTALITRRTIHKYEPEPIDEQALLQALEAALRAPNHKLTNPWRFTRVGPEGRAAMVSLGLAAKARKKGGLSERQREKYRAKFANPAELIVVSQVLDDDPFRRREDYAAIACAIENMMVSLWADGIGSKWSTGAITRSDEAYEALDIDRESEEIVGFVWAGVPAEIPDPPRLALDKVVRHTD